MTTLDFEGFVEFLL
jgi:hypothetical protein